LIQEYNYYSSDGYNTLKKKIVTSKRFVLLYRRNGIKDSLTYTIKYNDSIQLITIRRYKEDSIKNKSQNPKKSDCARQSKIKGNKKNENRVNGYNTDLKNYNFRQKARKIEI
jgi:hypothetical protein